MQTNCANFLAHPVGACLLSRMAQETQMNQSGYNVNVSKLLFDEECTPAVVRDR